MKYSPIIKFFQDLQRPSALAVDYLDNNLYWTDLEAKTIGIVSLKYLEVPPKNSSSNLLNKQLISEDTENLIDLTIDVFGR